MCGAAAAVLLLLSRKREMPSRCLPPGAYCWAVALAALIASCQAMATAPTECAITHKCATSARAFEVGRGVLHHELVGALQSGAAECCCRLPSRLPSRLLLLPRGY